MSRYKALNAIAYEHLREMIYNGELTFNQIYSQTKLAAQLSISRTPMRDALNRLSQEGCIDILPNRGFTLHAPTQGDIADAYHVRMMMEGYCARLVARDYPGAGALDVVGRMEDALDRQQLMMDGADAYSLSRFWLEDLRFHKTLLQYIGVSSLVLQYERIMYIFMPHHLIRRQGGDDRLCDVLERHRGTLVEHAAILEALNSRDPARAEAAVRAHLDSGLRALFTRLKA